MTKELFKWNGMRFKVLFILFATVSEKNSWEQSESFSNICKSSHKTESEMARSVTDSHFDNWIVEM